MIYLCFPSYCMSIFVLVIVQATTYELSSLEAVGKCKVLAKGVALYKGPSSGLIIERVSAVFRKKSIILNKKVDLYAYVTINK